MPLLAIALGNPLRQDDGAGAAIARALAEALPGLEVVETLELLPEHAEAAAQAGALLLLDASATSAPGEVRVEPIVPAPARPAMVHALRPEELVGLARALYGRAPPAALITIGGKAFDFGEVLSPEVSAAIPEACRRAQEWAKATMGSSPPT
jgi:hydrogenase maturation protease